MCMQRRRMVTISLGAIWGLVGSVWVMTLLEGTSGGLESSLPFSINILVSLPAFLWWVASHQIYESFQLPPIVFGLLLVIPSILIGGIIGYGIDRLVRKLPKVGR